MDYDSKKVILTKGERFPKEVGGLMKSPRVLTQALDRHHPSGWEDNPGNLQSILLPKLAYWAPDHILARVQPLKMLQPGAGLPAHPSPSAMPRHSLGRPRRGRLVPSSATVAAQPDSRNLLIRGHLCVSGSSVSSFSGTDIQQQVRTTGHP